MKSPQSIRAAILALPLSLACAYGASDRIGLSRPTVTTEIAAESAKVWKKLVSPEGISALGLGETKGKALEKVGDNAHITLAGDEGNAVVTHVEPAKVLRIAFEPDRGHYICSVRFELKPQGKGTALTYADWYSEEKSDQAEKNLKDTEKSMSEGAARFKALVEKASAAK